MKSILVIIVCVISATISFSQQTLKGKVVTSDSRKPIVSANVFLSNTSVGTITNENGEFSITHFPEGRYDLVVSYIGYESYVVSLQSNKLPIGFEIVLKPKVNELQEVVLEPYEKNGWEKWGSFFIENFIGTTSFAEDCKFLNKEVMKFRFSRKKNVLQAFADDRLVIENKALGYILKYDLTRFEYDFNTRLFIYQGYPLFEEMEAKREGIRKRWIANREEAYYGSMMHFMRSLYRNKLIEQHFEVRRLIRISTEEQKRVKAAYVKAQMPVSMSGGVTIVTDDSKSVLPADTLEYYRKVMRDPDAYNILINRVLPGDSIAYAIDSIMAGFEFSNNLQIIYTPKKTPPEYARFMHKTVTGPITSDIFKINADPLVVLANGSYFEASNLISSGYWAWSEKTSALLPMEYWPPPKTKK